MSERKEERKMQLLIGKILKKMNVQEKLIKELGNKINNQQEILEMYYTAYQEMKRQNQKKYLMSYIRLRDDISKDIERIKENKKFEEEVIDILDIYREDLSILLEDNGVEILECCEGEVFDPEIQKPLEKIKTKRKEFDNKVIRVFSCGYRWKGIILKKIYVSIGDFDQ